MIDIMNIVFYSLIGLSLTGLGFIIFKKIPSLAALSEEEIAILSRRKSLWQRMKGIDYKHYWFNLIVWFEKMLRKVKIFFLKIDNILSAWIKNLRRRSQMAAQRSRDWIRQKDIKRKKKSADINLKDRQESNKIIIKEEPESRQKESKRSEQPDEKAVSGNRSGDDSMSEPETEMEKNYDIPLDELKKPIKEEQKWIDLIVENPKNITAYKFLGLLYWQQHNYADAKKSLEIAAKLGSRDKKVKDVLRKLKKMGVK